MPLASFYLDAEGYERCVGWRLGDFQRGMRVTSLFLAAANIGREEVSSLGHPWHDHALFLTDLGRPTEAERVLHTVLESLIDAAQQVNAANLDSSRKTDPRQYRGRLQHIEEAWLYYESIVLESLCDAMIAQGMLTGRTVRGLVFLLRCWCQARETAEWMCQELRGSPPTRIRRSWATQQHWRSGRL